MVHSNRTHQDCLDKSINPQEQSTVNSSPHIHAYLTFHMDSAGSKGGVAIAGDIILCRGLGNAPFTWD